jgi:uncharacterized protein (DUF1778 family)
MERNIKSDNTRFDIKLTTDQKALFERAAKLGGYHTLTDFVVSNIEEKAKSIIEQREAVLATGRDRNVFFDAIMNRPKPGKRLQQPAERYRKLSNQSTES